MSLVRAGAPLTLADREGETVLHAAAVRSWELLHTFLMEGELENSIVLLYAVMHGDTAVATVSKFPFFTICVGQQEYYRWFCRCHTFRLSSRMSYGYHVLATESTRLLSGHPENVGNPSTTTKCRNPEQLHLRRTGD